MISYALENFGFRDDGNNFIMCWSLLQTRERREIQKISASIHHRYHSADEIWIRNMSYEIHALDKFGFRDDNNNFIMCWSLIQTQYLSFVNTESKILFLYSFVLNGEKLFTNLVRRWLQCYKLISRFATEIRVFYSLE